MASFRTRENEGKHKNWEWTIHALEKQTTEVLRRVFFCQENLKKKTQCLILQVLIVQFTHIVTDDCLSDSSRLLQH